MRVVIETGPVGDHDPEVYDNAVVIINEYDSLEVYKDGGRWQGRSKMIGFFKEEDWTQYTVTNEVPF